MKKEEPSMLGILIDCSLEDFEKELKRQEVNIGTMHNITLSLEGIYFELKTRKEAILKLVFEGKRSKDDPDIKKALDGLYAEMIKVEQKITYLKQRVKELVNVD